MNARSSSGRWASARNTLGTNPVFSAIARIGSRTSSGSVSRSTTGKREIGSSIGQACHESSLHRCAGDSGRKCEDGHMANSPLRPGTAVVVSAAGGIEYQGVLAAFNDDVVMI